MGNVIRNALDACAALALVGALIVVYCLDRAPDNAPVPPPGPHELPQRKLAMAVASSQEKTFDDMGKLLKELGEGHSFTDISLEDPGVADKIKPFDVIFVTCGAQPKAWFSTEGGREGGTRIRSYGRSIR